MCILRYCFVSRNCTSVKFCSSLNIQRKKITFEEKLVYEKLNNLWHAQNVCVSSFCNFLNTALLNPTIISFRIKQPRCTDFNILPTVHLSITPVNDQRGAFFFFYTGTSALGLFYSGYGCLLRSLASWVVTIAVYTDMCWY